MAPLEGKVALVTGASRGIGAGIARRLATDGADVAITYLHGKEQAAAVVGEIESTGRRGLAIEADASDADATVGAVRQTVARLGRIDVLVNNAGIFPYGPLEDVPLEDVDRTLAIHTRAVFVASQAAARHMASGGRIISIGSSFAERVPFPGITLYAMSKSALTGFTRGLARDLGPRDITVNLVQPGSTDTDMNPADGPKADEERALTALGRYGDIEDIASVVAYLAGPGGRQITGTTATVDGGASA